jgi:hypothetical protein
MPLCPIIYCHENKSTKKKRRYHLPFSALIKEINMYGLGRTINYNIFKCIFPGCNKSIPVEFFLSHNNYSTGISFLQKDWIDLSHDLIAIDVSCPFCRHPNHFRVMDRVKEISKQEYDAQIKVVKSSSSSVEVSCKVKTQAESAFPTVT